MFSLENLDKMNQRLMGFWKLVYLNILWILFTLLGLGLLGVGPATYALTKYFDQWFRLKNEPPVFKTFWMYYKERFKQSVFVSWILLAVSYVLIVNLFNLTAWYLQVANVLALVVLIIGGTHVYTVMAALTFETIPEILRASLMIGVGYLHYTIILWTVVLGFQYVLSITYPSLLFLFGIGFTIASIVFVGKRIIGDFEDETTEGKENKKMVLKGE